MELTFIVAVKDVWQFQPSWSEFSFQKKYKIVIIKSVLNARTVMNLFCITTYK